MDAIILVGGMGTRLRPLTADRHKSLLPICNRPVFDYLLEWAIEGGITRAVLAIGRANEDLAAAYPSGDWQGLELLPVFETEPLQSGGAIRNAVSQAQVKGRFVVLNGDILTDFSLAGMVASHSTSGAELSIALHAEDDARQYGVATVDGESMIRQFVEKSPEPPSNLVNAGAWVFEPQLVERIPAGAVRVEETLFPDLVETGGRVLGYLFEGLWADIGTSSRYLSATLEMLDRGHPGLGDSIVIGEGATVQRSALGARSAVGAGARVLDSVLWENVTVGAHVSIQRSAIANDASVGDGAQLVGCVLGPRTRIAPGAVVPPGTTVEAEGEFGMSDD